MKATRLLLDTHILLWLIDTPDRLDKHVYEDIFDYNIPVFVSVETLREIVILQHLKKINVNWNLKELLVDIEEQNIKILDINIKHIQTLETLSHPIVDGKPHDDPFDRMLIAQAISERLTLVSSDRKFPYYKDRGFDLLQN